MKSALLDFKFLLPLLVFIINKDFEVYIFVAFVGVLHQQRL